MQINPMDINDAIAILKEAKQGVVFHSDFAWNTLRDAATYLEEQLEDYFADDTPTTILFAAIGSSNMDSDPTKFFEACGIPVGAA